MKRNFYVKVWKDDNALYFPSGETKMISCDHTRDGDTWGVSIAGHIFPLPQTRTLPETSPPWGSPPTDWVEATVLVKGGQVYDGQSPFPTGDADYKICVRIKDNVTLVTSYVDATDYANKLYMCSPVNKDA